MVEDIIRNISLKLFYIGPVVKENVFQKYFLSRALAALTLGGVELICAILVEGILGSILMRFFFKSGPVV